VRKYLNYIIALLVCMGLTFLTGCSEKMAKEDKINASYKTKTITFHITDSVYSDNEVEETIKILGERMSEYTTMATFYRQGEAEIVLEIPEDAEYSENFMQNVLIANAQIYFVREKDSNGNANYSFESDENGGFVYQLTRPIEDLVSTGDTIITGNEIKSAKAASMQNSLNNTEYLVSLSFNESGTEMFAKATQYACENGETIAIVCDGKILSAPNVSATINNGIAQISGNFTYEEVDAMATKLGHGSLPLALEIVSE